MPLSHGLGWCLLAICGMANGIVRERTYARHLGELRAHQLSTLFMAVAATLVSWCLARGWPLRDGASALRVGGGWLALTIAFEFVFGRYVAGHSWTRLWADYDLRRGRLWGLFLAWLAALPAVMFALTGADRA